MQDWSLFSNTFTLRHRLTCAPGFVLLISLSILLFLGLLVSVLSQSAVWFIRITLLILVWETAFVSGIFIVAWINLYRPKKQAALGPAPTMTVIIPSWNEAEALPRTLDSLLAQADQPETIIVSDDGSTDDSLDRLVVTYGIEFTDGSPLGRSRHYSNLHALRKPHSGKADTLNQAIALSRDDVVIVLDADTRLYPGAIASVRQSFAQDPSIHAVAGVPVPSCSNTWHGKFFQFFQRYEYMRTFTWFVSWNTFDALTVVSGACSAFRREKLIAVRGYDPNSWTEDCEIIFHLQAYLRSQGKRFRVKVDPKFLTQTDAPDTILSFLRQRRRWAGGFLETLVAYRHMVGDRRYRALGLGHLADAALSIMNPFNAFVGTVGALSFFVQGYLFPVQVFILVVVLWVYSVLISCGRLVLYQSQIGCYKLSWSSMLLESLVAPVVYQPLTTISHIWGYYLFFKRQRSW